jgi:hypothetical protein
MCYGVWDGRCLIIVMEVRDSIRAVHASLCGSQNLVPRLTPRDCNQAGSCCTRKSAVAAAAVRGRLSLLRHRISLDVLTTVAEFTVCWKYVLGYCIAACYPLHNDYVMMAHLMCRKSGACRQARGDGVHHLSSCPVIMTHSATRDYIMNMAIALEFLQYLTEGEARLVCLHIERSIHDRIGLQIDVRAPASRSPSAKEMCYWRRMLLGTVLLQGPRLWLVAEVSRNGRGADLELRQVEVGAFALLLRRAHGIKPHSDGAAVSAKHIAAVYNTSTPLVVREAVLRSAPVALSILFSKLTHAYANAYRMTHRKSRHGQVFTFNPKPRSNRSCTNLAIKLQLGGSPPGDPIFIVA